MSKLTLSQHVLTLGEGLTDDDEVCFYGEAADDGMFPQPAPRAIPFLVFGLQSWQDMGEPEEITITIEPGDLLND